MEFQASNLLIHFKNNVALNSHSPLIHYYGSTFSIGEVDALSDAFAMALMNLGVQRSDRVALYMQNIPQFIISMLSIWKIGAIAVNVNPMSKEKELKYALTDSGAKIIICIEDLYDIVRAVAHDCKDLNSIITTSQLEYLHPESIKEFKRLFSTTRCGASGSLDFMNLVAVHGGKRPSLPDLKLDDVALITYTSGTTGPPKGAMNTHGNIIVNTVAFGRWIEVNHNDCCLGVAPFFHITGSITVTLCLVFSFPIVLTYRFDPTILSILIDRYRPSFMVGAITVYTALLNDPSATPNSFSSLKKLYSGGAPISVPILEQFQKKYGLYIRPVYGLTETTAPSHATPLHSVAPRDPNTGALSVGIPITNVESWIVDENKKELPIGEIGEIAIRGPMVMKGYWNKPEETTNAIDKNGIFYTGDIGFRDQAGWYYIVDRKKDLIIASGYKIWPKEVEDVIYELPAVSECAVVGIPDEYRGETVKAFVSVKKGQTITSEQIIEHCKNTMAAYKYPRIVEIIAEIPKNLSGKILRRELRAKAIQMQYTTKTQ